MKEKIKNKIIKLLGKGFKIKTTIKDNSDKNFKIQVTTIIIDKITIKKIITQNKAFHCVLREYIILLDDDIIYTLSKNDKMEIFDFITNEKLIKHEQYLTS